MYGSTLNASWSRTDDEIYRCIFVLAWWQRFLCGDRAEGNDHCRGMLEHMLSYPGSRASSIFAPAIELLQSCTSPEVSLSFGNQCILQLSDS
jgi:hypothetical protein